MTPKIQELQAQYDLLSEKIARLRNAIAIENDPTSKFKFEKQLEDAEQERERLERALQQLEQSGALPPEASEAAPAAGRDWLRPWQRLSPVRYALIGFIACALGVAGWWWYELQTTPFSITIYVRDSNGGIVLKNTGSILLELGDLPQERRIGAYGEAFFEQIYPTFRNQPVLLRLNAEGFELAQPQQQYILTGKSLYVEIKRADRFTKFFGTVRDADHFLNDVAIRIGELQTTTDAQGSFTLTIPPDKPAGQQRLIASKEGYRIWESFVYPGQEIKIILTKQP